MIYMSLIVEQKTKHSPTLNTVIMVENAIKNSENSVVTMAEIKRALPRQVNHETLKTVLRYLDRSNKIAVSLDGIVWIHNTSPKMEKAIREGREL
jgi:hypothetical protein